MCGLIGIIQKGKGKENLELISSLSTIELVKRRGPDQIGLYQNDDLSLFHSRLVVSSKPQDDKQPFMQKIDNKESILCFNGEIFNWKSITTKDYFVPIKGDTSSLFNFLNSFQVNSLNELRGEFSFFFQSLLGDRYLVRDQLGVKPLYYAQGFQNREKFLVFSTNFRAVAEVVSKKVGASKLNTVSLRQFKEFRYVLDPQETLFEGVLQVPPGHYLEITNDLELILQKYWELPEKDKLKKGNFEEFNSLLNESIDLRIPSLKKFGTFLSGGLDSGYLTFLAKDKPGFLGGFNLEVPGNENEDMRRDRFLSSSKVRNFSFPFLKTKDSIDNTFKAMDVPIGDSVVFLIDQLYSQSSQNAKVFLGGDGADELFGGYVHHKIFFLGNLFNKIFPGLSRKLGIKLVENLPISFFQTFFPYKGSLNQEGIDKLVRFLKTFSHPGRAYQELVSLGGKESESLLDEVNFSRQKWTRWKNNNFSLHELLRFDLSFWGPGYSLNKNDYFAGFYGLEVRQPYYDHKLVEWVLSHEIDLLNLRQDKILLRQAASTVNFNLSKELKSPFRIEDSLLIDLGSSSSQDLLVSKRMMNDYILNRWLKEEVKALWKE